MTIIKKEIYETDKYWKEETKNGKSEKEHLEKDKSEKWQSVKKQFWKGIHEKRINLD